MSKLARLPRPSDHAIHLPTAYLCEVSPGKARSVPPPLPKRPVSGPTLTGRPKSGGPRVGLFVDALANLDAQPDALAAARVCVDALAAALPCRALLVHAFDATRRSFLVVHARGEAAESMLLTRHPTHDPLLRVAMPRGEPFAWGDLRRAPVNHLARFTDLRGVRTVLHAPVVSGPHWLGALELVDPLNGAAFIEQDLLGARYVARRYAQFLTRHGVILDVGTIARFANTRFESAEWDIAVTA